MQQTFLPIESSDELAKLRVIGVGGGGGNAVRHMVDQQLEDVDFICANTDSQALKDIKNCVCMRIGEELTAGLGAGADPDVGRQAAMEDRDAIRERIQGANMLFITAGMGGGTGTGAAPIVAQVAKELNILTVAIVTKPFPFEGNKRMAIAEAGIEELSQSVDSLITIPNEKLLTELGSDVSLLDAFKEANDVLLRAVQGITELITRPGLINVDFADVKTVMDGMGMAMMGAGVATGENRAIEAAEKAIHSPLLEDVNIQGAGGILVNVTAGLDIKISEFEKVGAMIRDIAADDATVVVGTVIDPEMEGELRVTLVATGLNGEGKKANVENVTQLQRKSSGEVDYQHYERPTAIRHKGSSAKAAVAKQAAEDIDYLDVPAFLRRQAD